MTPEELAALQAQGWQVEPTTAQEAPPGWQVEEAPGLEEVPAEARGRRHETVLGPTEITAGSPIVKTTPEVTYEVQVEPSAGGALISGMRDRLATAAAPNADYHGGVAPGPTDFQRLTAQQDSAARAGVGGVLNALGGSRRPLAGDTLDAANEYVRATNPGLDFAAQTFGLSPGAHPLGQTPSDALGWGEDVRQNPIAHAAGGLVGSVPESAALGAVIPSGAGLSRTGRVALGGLSNALIGGAGAVDRPSDLLTEEGQQRAATGTLLGAGIGTTAGTLLEAPGGFRDLLLRRNGGEEATRLTADMLRAREAGLSSTEALKLKRQAGQRNILPPTPEQQAAIEHISETAEAMPPSARRTIERGAAPREIARQVQDVGGFRPSARAAIEAPPIEGPRPTRLQEFANEVREANLPGNHAERAAAAEGQQEQAGRLMGDIQRSAVDRQGNLLGGTDVEAALRADPRIRRLLSSPLPEDRAGAEEALTLVREQSAEGLTPEKYERLRDALARRGNVRAAGGATPTPTAEAHAGARSALVNAVDEAVQDRLGPTERAAYQMARRRYGAMAGTVKGAERELGRETTNRQIPLTRYLTGLAGFLKGGLLGSAGAAAANEALRSVEHGGRARFLESLLGMSGSSTGAPVGLGALRAPAQAIQAGTRLATHPIAQRTGMRAALNALQPRAEMPPEAKHFLDMHRDPAYRAAALGRDQR